MQRGGSQQVSPPCWQADRCTGPVVAPMNNRRRDVASRWQNGGLFPQCPEWDSPRSLWPSSLLQPHNMHTSPFRHQANYPVIGTAVCRHTCTRCWGGWGEAGVRAGGSASSPFPAAASLEQRLAVAYSGPLREINNILCISCHSRTFSIFHPINQTVEENKPRRARSLV